MTIFIFDNTLEGLLTSVFEAYARRLFPDTLVAEGAPLPLFHEQAISVHTDEAKAKRVWHGLEKRLSPTALRCVAACWLAEEADTPDVMFRFLRKVFDSPRRIETNFGDPDVLAFTQMWRRVNGERTRLMQFLRFQKAADGTYFAPLEPEKNALPLLIPHLRDRFADQRWLIWDMKRAYGFYYDLHEVHHITFQDTDSPPHLSADGRLAQEMLDKDELFFQSLWKTYFHAIAIRERTNPRKQRSDMPVRYWKYLTEKQ